MHKTVITIFALSALLIGTQSCTKLDPSSLTPSTDTTGSNLKTGGNSIGSGEDNPNRSNDNNPGSGSGRNGSGNNGSGGNNSSGGNGGNGGNSSNDSTNNNNGGQNATAGKWVVSYFFDKKDETYHYTSYTFDFQTSGVLTATKGSQSISGTWKEITNSSSKRMIINFNTTNADLVELNDDWVITSKTATEIKLKDDNTKKVEELFFKKL